MWSDWDLFKERKVLVPWNLYKQDRDEVGENDAELLFRNYEKTVRWVGGHVKNTDEKEGT